MIGYHGGHCITHKINETYNTQTNTQTWGRHGSDAAGGHRKIHREAVVDLLWARCVLWAQKIKHVWSWCELIVSVIQWHPSSAGHDQTGVQHEWIVGASWARAKDRRESFVSLSWGRHRPQSWLWCSQWTIGLTGPCSVNSTIPHVKLSLKVGPIIQLP